MFGEKDRLGVIAIPKTGTTSLGQLLGQLELHISCGAALWQTQKSFTNEVGTEPYHTPHPKAAQTRLHDLAVRKLRASGGGLFGWLDHAALALFSEDTNDYGDSVPQSQLKCPKASLPGPGEKIRLAHPSFDLRWTPKQLSHKHIQHTDYSELKAAWERHRMAFRLSRGMQKPRRNKTRD